MVIQGSNAKSVLASLDYIKINHLKLISRGRYLQSQLKKYKISTILIWPNRFHQAIKLDKGSLRDVLGSFQRI